MIDVDVDETGRWRAARVNGRILELEPWQGGVHAERDRAQPRARRARAGQYKVPWTSMIIFGELPPPVRDVLMALRQDTAGLPVGRRAPGRSDTPFPTSGDLETSPCRSSASRLSGRKICGCGGHGFDAAAVSTSFPSTKCTPAEASDPSLMSKCAMCDADLDSFAFFDGYLDPAF